MIERLLITLLIGIVMVMTYQLLQRYQRRRVTTVTQKTVEPSQAKILYFRSDHCGACLAQGHYLEALEAHYRMLIEPIDVEQAPELARQDNIMTLPTTILIDDQGSVRHINPGLANPFKLTRQLDALQK